jgi:protein-ribulosamine 3-kinase
MRGAEATVDAAYVSRLLSRALGERVEVQAPRGRALGATAVLATSRGRCFVKTGPAAAGQLASEAVSLAALERATRGALVVPKVLAVDDAALVLEHLEPGASPQHDERLGRGLALLHRASAERFGFEVDTYCGATRQPNAWRASWVELFREQRLLHLVGLLERRGRLGAHERALFDRLASTLDERLSGADEPPSLIHGDLWSGNALSTPGGPALVDPSSSYSHREAELGMMTLFGGFSRRTFDAYEEAFPLAAGHLERRAFYELYHVLNHAALFGGGYVAEALERARRLAR